MKRKITSLFILLVISLTFPIHVFALEFSISETTIHAYLQENGNVLVHETHTYTFDDAFNGITRELIPKEGTNIVEFTAYENGQALQTEREGHLYRIYRSGDHETITVDLHYTIEHGMGLYPDVGEFYWPFFDRSNESDYEQLTVTVHPPAPTDAEVIAFGADEAFDKETVQADGIVVFHFGHVPAGRNGDIRVAYDANLFPSAALTSQQPMRDTLLQARQSGIDREEKRQQTRKQVEHLANYVLPAFTAVFLLLIVRALVEARNKQIAVLWNLQEHTRPVPEFVMTLPATLHYLQPFGNQASTLTAALLDLARQGYVEKSSGHSFHLIRQDSPHAHERILLEWLFEEVGTGEAFRFDDLQAYVKKQENHETYVRYQNRWQKAIMNEVREHKLHKKILPTRLFSAFLLLALIIFLIILIASQVAAGYFVWTIGLVAGFLLFPLLYFPKTMEGLQIVLEWQQFMERFRSLSRAEWNKWTEAERTRAFLFTTGMNRKDLSKKNEELIPELKRASDERSQEPAHDTGDMDRSSFNIVTYALIASFVSTGFQDAERVRNAASSDSTGGFSGGGGSGGGAGGGGGGSGAF